ncbi:MAG TPA: M20/M25/M40 family metallo-hydrolase [Rhizomicrobium sp.]|nr:M20/M25/M40 family metallo-hydrolase [Rhizomicrobium sp.]
MRYFTFALILFWVGPLAAQETDHPLLHQVAADVRTDALHATIARLVGFGTRHSLSGNASAARGIGAAQAYVKGEFARISASCGSCITIETPAESFTGARVPVSTPFMDVLAIQRGVSDPGRVIIIAGHLDSRNTDIMDAVHDAPGADDDGSGTAAVLEAARVLSAHKFPATLVYAVLTGEEQGLYGGSVLAHYAASHQWNVEADLNNDIIGNSHGGDGTADATHVRIFSEGTRDLESEAAASGVRYNGGEIDSPARNLARFIATLAPRYLENFNVRLVYRTDRYGRGGDQVPVLAAGYPAVRLTEAKEDYSHEHQNVRVENGVAYGDVIGGVDFDYLAQVARLNIVSMAALAMAPAPPAVRITGAVTYDTTLSWASVPGAASYRAWWRDSLDPEWTHSQFAGNATSVTLPHVNIDDWLFGVSSVSADGYESPVSFPFSERP